MHEEDASFFIFDEFSIRTFSLKNKEFTNFDNI